MPPAHSQHSCLSLSGYEMVGCSTRPSLVVSQTTPAYATHSRCTQMTLSLLQQQWIYLFFFCLLQKWSVTVKAFKPPKHKDWGLCRLGDITHIYRMKQCQELNPTREKSGSSLLYIYLREYIYKIHMKQTDFLQQNSILPIMHQTEDLSKLWKAHCIPGIHQAEGSPHCCDPLIRTWQIFAEQRYRRLVISTLSLLSHSHL